MKNMKKFVAALSLTLVLALSAIAGELQTPPCAQPVPGELQTPPCTTEVLPDDPAAGQQSTTPEGTATSLLTEATIDLLESLLSIY